MDELWMIKQVKEKDIDSKAVICFCGVDDGIFL